MRASRQAAHSITNSAWVLATVAQESGAERRALYVVAATFFLLAAYIAVEAGSAVIGRGEPHRSGVGLLLSVLSLLIMPTPLVEAAHRPADGKPCLIADSVETWCARICRWPCWPA
jgi:isoprenylcysteine carboxyl methyltransferase (ICMT) family protein YpbQ